MYTITPKQAAVEIRECIFAGLTPFLVSSPGMGKSQIAAQFAKEYKLKMIDLRLSQCAPEDLNGLPMRNGHKATFTPFDNFPIEGDPIPEGYNGWLLFLDEMTSASKPVQAASYKLILDRMVGTHHLHHAVAIMAAGNKSTDRAIVNSLSTALQSRVITYELTVSKDDFLEHAVANGFDHRITGFISYMPSRLMDFRPDHQDFTFACPRTWEFLSRLIKGKDVSPDIAPRVAGTIGSGTAAEFITFAQEYTRIPKFDDIVADPTVAKIPDEMSTKYATISMLIEKSENQFLASIIRYVERLDIELQIIFCRGVHNRDKTLPQKNQDFKAYLQRMVRYLQ